MTDVTEILVHWYAGRSQSEVATSLGVDRKTIKKYVSAAIEAGMVPGGPPMTGGDWAELIGKWFPQSFRAELLAAARKGEAFDVVTGRPVSMGRPAKDLPWYELACGFADMKWPRVAATTRRTHAEALTKITTAMLASDRGKPG